jgi:hypothetical protein
VVRPTSQTQPVGTATATLIGVSLFRATLVLSCASVTALSLVASTGSATRPKAPAIGGVTLEGKRVTLAQFRGRPVLINVWSSW